MVVNRRPPGPWMSWPLGILIAIAVLVETALLLHIFGG